MNRRRLEVLLRADSTMAIRVSPVAGHFNFGEHFLHCHARHRNPEYSSGVPTPHGVWCRQYVSSRSLALRSKSLHAFVERTDVSMLLSISPSDSRYVSNQTACNLHACTVVTWSGHLARVVGSMRYFLKKCSLQS